MSGLTNRLAALRDRYDGILKPEFAEVVKRQIRELRESGLVERMLKAGDIAPAFALADQAGSTVSSTELLEGGPLVISFFRGTWCPYCNEELAALNDSFERIASLGARLVAVTPQSAENARGYLSEHPTKFPILVDPHASVANSFGVAFTVPDYLADLYKNVFANDLALVNADHSWRLPVPARFVIGRDGIVEDAEADADYRYRPDPQSTIAVLERIHSGSRRFGAPTPQ